MNPEPIVTRFAPSPTGHLHIGGARTALFCWAFARHAGPNGRFMIRIEDTDQARSSDESARGILEDLAWLGITWDDGPVLGDIGRGSRPVGPYFQAQRLDIYNRYVEHLGRLGRAYPAFETADELDAARRAAAAQKKTFKYPRPADVRPGEFNEARWRRAAAGEPHVVRFAMPPEGIRVHDSILGEVKFAPGEVDDFVIRKADGFPTYHFAVVIDDELMGVTHVLRAQEHLMNTPRHVALQQALTRTDGGAPFRTPVYAHMPLIFNMDGGKMSKRDKAKAARAALKAAMQKDPALTPALAAARAGLAESAVAEFLAGTSDAVEFAEALAGPFAVALPEVEVWDYRRSGYLPEVITNFLALLGWSPGMKSPDGKDVEKFDMEFLARHFSLERIGRGNAKFDRVKLLSFNADAIAAMTDDRFSERFQTWADEHEPEFARRWRALQAPRRSALLRLARPRCKTLRDLIRVVEFAMVADEAVAFDPAAVAKHLTPPGRDALAAFAQRLHALGPNADAAAIDAVVAAVAAERNAKLGEVAQPVRVGITGGTVSPPLGETVAAIGVASALRRIERCLQAR